MECGTGEMVDGGPAGRASWAPWASWWLLSGGVVSQLVAGSRHKPPRFRPGDYPIEGKG